MRITGEPWSQTSVLFSIFTVLSCKLALVESAEERFKTGKEKETKKCYFLSGKGRGAHPQPHEGRARDVAGHCGRLALVLPTGGPDDTSTCTGAGWQRVCMDRQVRPLLLGWLPPHAHVG